MSCTDGHVNMKGELHLTLPFLTLSYLWCTFIFCLFFFFSEFILLQRTTFIFGYFCFRKAIQKVIVQTTSITKYSPSFLIDWTRRKLVGMLFAILLLFHGSFCLEQKCPSGYKFQQSGTAPGACIQCENGVNFMPEEGHSNTHCYNCSQIDNPKADIVISECNRTHDTEILCRSGYYRYKARSILEKDSCRKCNQCRNSVRACEGYHDTVCCRPEDDAVLIHSGMFVCQKRPVLCGPGQYYNMALAGCSPCSPGTYMREVNHRNEECVKCETLSGNPAHHALVVFQCNITSPTLFGCEDGFFRDILHESLLLEAKCSPCRKCIREVTSCDMYHDAVCYISHDPVSDTGDSKNRTRINESSLESKYSSTNYATNLRLYLLFMSCSQTMRTL